MIQKEPHSGIYLLPNLLTTASLFAAFYSIVASMKGFYEAGVIAIFIATIADNFDGRIARLTNTQTEFGAQYDSLSDLVAFGVAPSLLIYSCCLQSLGKLGWLIAFIYTAAVALRLARFNTLPESANLRFFGGLPCPPSAAAMASFVWILQGIEWSHWSLFYLAGLLALSLALLMVSNLPYYSFKEIDFKGKVPFLYILICVILFVGVAINPPVIIFLSTMIYALSAPVYALWFRK